jgi:hypothetical protein
MNNFTDALRGYAFSVLKRDSFKCVYCGLDGRESFQAWLCLSWDHLLPRDHPLRDEIEYIATACKFCNGADNQYFLKAPERGITFEGKTREELIVQRKPYVLKTRDSYLEFWRANVLESSSEAEIVRLSARNVAIGRSVFTKRIEEKYRAELTLLDDIWQLGRSMSNEIRCSSGKERLFQAILLFSCVRTVCAMESIVLLLTLGNSADTALIFRSVFETLINILYIDKDPDIQSLLFARREVSDALKYFNRSLHAYAPLEQLPTDIVFPSPICNSIRYDREKHQLLFDGAVSENDRVHLLELSQDPAYQKAVDRLFQGSVRPEELESVTGIISSLEKQLSSYDSQIGSHSPSLEIPSGSSWSGKQTKEMAEDVGLGPAYDMMYWELSGVAHFSASSNLFFLEYDPSGERLVPRFYPNDTISKRIIRSSVAYALMIFKLVNEKMRCAKDLQIEQLDNRLTRLSGNSE